ncbi:MAG: hypothetical protein JO250_01390 [Armatimonadetes bacterium]|nr:hypothetical protein [Armatimonadota bacterium]
MQAEAPILLEDELDRLSQIGRAIYEDKLKAILEPAYNGQVVAIHLDSGDYEVAKYSRPAWTALRARRPAGMMMVTDIGPAKIDSLAVRMLASRTHSTGVMRKVMWAAWRST